eukprot:8838462-Heterocapsa_arctica.AAC.1
MSLILTLGCQRDVALLEQSRQGRVGPSVERVMLDSNAPVASFAEVLAEDRPAAEQGPGTFPMRQGQRAPQQHSCMSHARIVE